MTLHHNISKQNLILSECKQLWTSIIVLFIVLFIRSVCTLGFLSYGWRLTFNQNMHTYQTPPFPSPPQRLNPCHKLLSAPFVWISNPSKAHRLFFLPLLMKTKKLARMLVKLLFVLVNHSIHSPTKESAQTSRPSIKYCAYLTLTQFQPPPP